jgi:nucleoside-diphosphate-sugar epimerase
MRYLVTGATGFIGGSLARQLLSRGHEVGALVRDPSRASALKELGAELYTGDITDKKSLEAPMRGIDGVFHTAAWYKVGIHDHTTAYRTNVDGTRNVLEMMRAQRVPKGVHTSTIAVFSNTHGKVPNEEYRYFGKHLSVYDETKWKAHYEVALPMMEKHDLPLTIVMPGLVYGPGDTSIMGALFDRFLRGKLPVAAGGAEFCWTYIDDIVDGHIRAMERGTPGKSYILGGERASLVGALRTASEITGIEPPIFALPPWMLRTMSGASGVISRIIKVPQLYDAETLWVSAGVTYLGDSSRARKDLGFSPRSLREGFKEHLPVRMRELGLVG